MTNGTFEWPPQQGAGQVGGGAKYQEGGLAPDGGCEGNVTDLDFYIRQLEENMGRNSESTRIQRFGHVDMVQTEFTAGSRSREEVAFEE